MMVRISPLVFLRLAVVVGVLGAVIVLGCVDRGIPPQASAPSATIVAVRRIRRATGTGSASPCGCLPSRSPTSRTTMPMGPYGQP